LVVVKYKNLKMSIVKENNLKVIAFSGKQDDWKFWEVKFLARARRKGFREILLGKETIPKDNEKFDLSKLDEKAMSEIRKKNELTFEELVLLIDMSRGDGHIAFQSFCCCKNNNDKNGNAVDVWAQLMAKYVTNIAPKKLELKFQQSKLWDVTQDPNYWILDLESIQVWLKEIMSDILDEDVMVHVLNGLPPEYKVQVRKLEE